MGLAVEALLVLVVPLGLSGYAAYNQWGDGFGGNDWLEDLHEFFANALLMVVLVHLPLITGLSLLRRKNQARPMIGGRIDGSGPDLAMRNHAWLATLLLLLAVLGFGAWQWHESAHGLIPISASADAGGAKAPHHDRH